MRTPNLHTPRSVSRHLWGLGVEYDLPHLYISECYLRGYWMGRWDIDGMACFTALQNLCGMTKQDITDLIRL